MKRVICFARVSTLQQSLDAQVDAVRKQIFGDGYSEEQIIYIQGKESAIKLDEEQRQTLNEMKQLVSDILTLKLFISLQLTGLQDV